MNGFWTCNSSKHIQSLQCSIWSTIVSFPTGSFICQHCIITTFMLWSEGAWEWGYFKLSLNVRCFNLDFVLLFIKFGTERLYSRLFQGWTWDHNISCSFRHGGAVLCAVIGESGWPGGTQGATYLHWTTASQGWQKPSGEPAEVAIIQLTLIKYFMMLWRWVI